MSKIKITISVFLVFLLLTATTFATSWEELDTPEKVNAWMVANFTYDFSKLSDMMEEGFDTKIRIAKARKAGNDKLAEKIRDDYFMKWVDDARVTFQKKSGVCQDAGNMAAARLHELGYDARVLFIFFKYPSKSASGHAACAYKEKDGKWYIIGNTGVDSSCNVDPIIAGPYDTLDKAAKKLAFSYGVKYWIDHYRKGW